MIFILLSTVTSNSTLVQQRIKQTAPVAKIILRRFLQCKGHNYKHSGDNVICNVLINFDLTFCHPQHQQAYLKQIHFLASLNHKRHKHFNFSIIYIKRSLIEADEFADMKNNRFGVLRLSTEFWLSSRFEICTHQDIHYLPQIQTDHMIRFISRNIWKKYTYRYVCVFGNLWISCL